MHGVSAMAAAMLVTGAAGAASPFEGTWKGDPTTVQLPAKPDRFLLKDGTYHCSTCVPAIAVKADGAPHPVTGHPYFDAMAIQVVDAHGIKETILRGGKVVGTTLMTVSADGATVTMASRDMGAANGVATTATTQSRRVEAAPAGAHAISGAWRESRQGAKISDAALLFSFAGQGDRLRFTTPTGQAYTAALDGSRAPVTGAPGWTGVALKRTGPATMVETDYRDAKPVVTITMTVLPGGRSMRLVNQDHLHDTTTTVIALKQ